MRNFLEILASVSLLALAGCVYPGYSYVRADGGGYYAGDAYYQDDGAYAPAYYGGYPGYGYYGGYAGYGYTPSINIGLGYYPGGHYRGSHGQRGWHGHASGHYRHGNRGSHGGWNRGGPHGGRHRHHH